MPDKATILSSEMYFLARFWSKVIVGRPNQCWPWAAFLDKDGYGFFNVTPSFPMGAHRVAYIIATGKDLPDGVMVLHSCDNRACCNPAHLYEGGHARNMRDRSSRGRTRNQHTGPLPVEIHRGQEKIVTLATQRRRLAKAKNKKAIAKIRSYAIVDDE